MGFTGKPIDRIDGRLKVTGEALYAAEFNQKNMLYAFPIRATIGKGTVASFDTKEAREMKGVVTILTYKNAPKLREIVLEEFLKAAGLVTETVMPLQDDKVHYFGQYIGIAVAETYEQARAAANLVKVKYNKQPPAIDLKGELPKGKFPDKLLGEPAQINKGKAAAQLDAAPFKIEHQYATSTENHHPMEPHATIAVWHEDEKVLLYHATQGVVRAGGMIAYLFNLPPGNVRVISPFVGGGFGCKSEWGHIILATMAGRVVRRPVKLAITRQMMTTNVGRRGATIQTVALGADKDSKLSIIRHHTDTYSNLSAYFEACGSPTQVLYGAPLREITYRVANLNIGTPFFMRAPGEAAGSFALESAIDEMADKLNLDPLEFRRINHTPQDPISNIPFSSDNLLDCYRVGAERFGWSQRSSAPRSRRNGNFLIGYGMATATYPALRSSASVRVQLFSGNKAKVMSATQDIGPGTYTIMAQTAADALGILIENITVELGDSSLPPAPISAGSCTTASVNPAVLAAAEAVRKELLQLALKDKKSSLTGRFPEEVDFANGRFFLRSDNASYDTYDDILKRNKKNMLDNCAITKPESGPGFGPRQAPCMIPEINAEQNSNTKKYSFHSFGAHFVEVWVDEDLGFIRIKRFTSIIDVGAIMNEKTARSQVIGGIIFALGQALMEETNYDHRWANPVTRTLADYHVPVNLDIPDIDVQFIGKPDFHISPIGARGVGEIAGVGVAAAVANAVYNATGKRIRSLPLTPDKLL